MNDEEADNVVTGIGCLFSLAVLPIAIVYTGFALSYLWLWFFVPLGIMPIGMCHALGISTLISLYAPQNYNKKSDEQNTGIALVKTIFLRTIHSTFALVLGYIWHYFMQA